jgi:drug/metabolite transporter (DMT)-like permease
MTGGDPLGTPMQARSRRLRGYGLVIAAYVIFGSIGALADYATAPESMLLVLRFAIAASVLALLFARPRMLRELRRRGVVKRLLLMGVLDAASQLCFFISLRQAGVAVGMFLFYTAPVLLAVLGPRFTGDSTDRVVWPALTVGLAGLVAILAPGFGAAGHWSTTGVLCGVAAAVLFAVYMLVVKSLTTVLSSTTIVLADCTLNALFLLPLALAQTVGGAYALTGRDLLSALLLGLVCTAFGYYLWVEGVERVRVQHSSILGYLEPVTAPLYALALIGQRPGRWTLAGGALIIVAGLLLVLFGSPQSSAEERFA